ncbi:MAG: DUF503 domain-containing protein [Endomicrobiia bacterium]
MFVGSLKVDLFLPTVSSLKDKRRIIQSMKMQLRNKFNVSVSEDNNNNLWQRTTIGVSCITDSYSDTMSILQSVLEFILKFGEIEITNKEINIY